MIQKEVERKRRTNINEGIDLLVAQINIPDLEKQGKGVQLRRAVEYVAEMDERMVGFEKEVHELRKEKQDLEVGHSSLPSITVPAPTGLVSPFLLTFPSLVSSLNSILSSPLSLVSFPLCLQFLDTDNLV